MIKQSIRLKIFVLPISLLVVFLVSIFYIKPKISDLLASKAMLSEKQKQLTDLKKQNQKFSEIKKIWESIGEEKKLIQTALPEEKNIESYISEINSKANLSGVLLSNIAVGQSSGGEAASYLCGASSANSTSESGEVVSGSGSGTPASVVDNSSSQASSAAASFSNCLGIVNIALNVQGNWEQLMDFFKYLEDMNRVSSIDSTSITSQSQVQDQTASDLLNANVTVSAFFKKRNQSGSSILVNDLVQNGFNKRALEKLKNVIYSSYDVPVVEPAGSRNIFK